MAKDWRRLAEYAARRRAELGLSQIEVAHRGPLSLDRVQAIEGAKSTRYRLATLLALERALGWADGSVERILSGGEPGIAASGTARIGGRLKLRAKGTARPDEADPLAGLPEDPQERTRVLHERLDKTARDTARIAQELRRLTDRGDTA